MERERRNSKYARDPRIEWVNDEPHGDAGGVIFVRIAPEHVPDAPPVESDFRWDFDILDDERIEIGLPNDYQEQYPIYLVSGGRRRDLTWGGYVDLDRAIEVVLGAPK